MEAQVAATPAVTGKMDWSHWGVHKEHRGSTTQRLPQTLLITDLLLGTPTAPCVKASHRTWVQTELKMLGTVLNTAE